MRAAITTLLCSVVLFGCSETDDSDLTNRIEVSYYFCEGDRTYMSEKLRNETAIQKSEKNRHILGFKRERINLPNNPYITKQIYEDGFYRVVETNLLHGDYGTSRSILNENLGDLSFFQEITTPQMTIDIQRTLEFDFFSKRGSIRQIGQGKYLNYHDVFSCREITDSKELGEVPNKFTTEESGRG
jgi:hypothetical protein